MSVLFGHCGQGATMVNNPLAFPGAEGFGRHAKGGRGGDVYHVVNLNDSGRGSLREGLATANGPRTIIFRVAGTISLNSALHIDKPYITIAGQSAPGAGITLRNYGLRSNANHVIIRYIRSRLGDRGGFSPGGQISICIGDGSNVIIDHCSASWSTDETLSSSHEADLVTIQWCLSAEGLHDSISYFPSSYGGVIRGQRESNHHNLYAHHNSRLPKIAWLLNHKVDFRNNVIYNWGSQSCYDGTAAHANWANNYYKPGPATRPEVKHRIFRIEDKVEERTSQGLKETASFYIEGNYVMGSPKISANNWAGGVDFNGKYNEANTRARTPFDYPRISNETSAEEAYEVVLAGVGASLVRDAVDERIIQEVRTGTATFGQNGIIDSQEDVGGWPDIRPARTPRDTDNDGMPDWWETANSLNAREAADRNLDRNGDGYTNLEEYLNWLADPEGRLLQYHPRSKPKSWPDIFNPARP